MNWASTLKCVVCVLNLVMCARLVGPYMFPRKTGMERPRERRDVEAFYRFAAWVGILALVSCDCATVGWPWLPWRM